MDDVLAVSTLLIPASPLLVLMGTALARPFPAVFRRGWLLSIGCGVSFLAALAVMIVQVVSREALPFGMEIYRWIDISGDHPLSATVGLQVDPLSLSLLLAVSLATAAFAFHSTHASGGHLRKSPRSQVNDRQTDLLIPVTLFAISMLLLSPSFLQLLVFWQLTVWSVGVCANERGSSITLADPAPRIVLVNLAGDVLFVTGILLIWLYFDAIDFTAVFGNRTMIAVVRQTNPAALSVISLCLLAGVLVRCAQFPLVSWITDDPAVSARANRLLQTTAVMPAGIYVIVRCMPLFEASPVAMQLTAFAGALTAVLAAAMAIAARDLDRVLGHTTVSHFGWMLLGIGIGSSEGTVAALFLLMVHVLIKGSLFQLTDTIETAEGAPADSGPSPQRSVPSRGLTFGLTTARAGGAGNLMNVDSPQTGPAIRLGPLRKKLPAVHWTFLAASLVLFSGFWGQNAVLTSIWNAVESPASAPRSDRGDESEQLPSKTGDLDSSVQSPAEALNQSPSEPPLLRMPPRTQHLVLLALATLALMFAAFAQFRAYFLTFYHEGSSVTQTRASETAKPRSCLPAMLLVAATIVLGPLAGTQWSSFSLVDWVLSAATGRGAVDPFGPGFGVSLVMLAIVAAWMLYAQPSVWPARISQALAPFDRLCRYRFYLGDIFRLMLVLPMRGLAQLCRIIDRHFVDGIFVGFPKTFLSEVDRTAAPLRVGLISFYVTSLLLATAVLAAVVSMLRGQV